MINCVIIGTGNMAEALLKSVKTTDIEIVGIYGKSIAKSEALSLKYAVNSFTALNEIPTHVDLYLLCVSDNAIAEVATQLNIGASLAVHFSGIKQLEELGTVKNKAVFWPIESVNKNSFTDFTNTPVCIEANTDENYRIIEAFADRLSKKVLHKSSIERQYLHLAATISNNFSNHLLALTKQILDEQNIDYKLLQHLVSNGINNAFNFDPALIQTGAAVRNDTETIHTHKMLLHQNIDLIALYELMSKSIFDLKQRQHA
ncbi:MAG: DUF2520 domain-containing protein [Bacteroidota bacterium]